MMNKPISQAYYIHLDRPTIYDSQLALLNMQSAKSLPPL
ncbi:hypothetical protein J2Y44_003642 [Dyadobacter sp. BE32]|nr:hypothetical protein [Dyadobacter sp. BE32]